MTIPLDDLYHYINGLFPEPVCMYLFLPHGSRNILNLTGLEYMSSYCRVAYPQVICNDQEPLNYHFYQNIPKDVVEKFKKIHQRTNFDNNLKIMLPNNIHDKILLLHSEKNSEDLKLYQSDGYQGVYYWCNAIIARDWYRFAEYDKRLQSSNIPTKNFLIYCRDWSGSREYRIKFQELLYKNNLVGCSITGIVKNNIDDVKFSNINFIPEHKDFFYNLSDNTHLSSASAHYCAEDFVDSHISVVLETIFDGPKIHLTEKILRPIACGHPFILAAGPGSLEYLRSYGFQTFAPWIDETYDQEHNSVKRLEKIIAAMSEFSNLTSNKKQSVIDELKKVADYNKKWFFSKSFMHMVEQELKENINVAIKEIKKTRSHSFRSRSKHYNDIKHLRYLGRTFIAQHLNNLRKLNPPGQ
jgi:hypothetical protein